MQARSPLRNSSFKRWCGIEFGRVETMPPLRERVLLYSAITGARSFQLLQSDAHRVAVLSRYLYTHWRDISTIDSP